VVIVGPTSSGKSELAVRLAKKWGGEVISADSRQVYKGLNIGTGKITKKEMCDVPHYLLDIVSARNAYTAAQYKKDAEKIVRYIVQKGKIPIIVGGTGFYIDTLLGTISIPEVPPNKKLREKLEKQSIEKLLEKLKRIDPRRAKTVEPKHKRRIIRAIEIATALGRVPIKKRVRSQYDVLKIGITVSDTVLKKNIKKRLVARMKQGMVAEAKRLHQKGLSWKRMEELGLEYRYLAQHLQGKLSKEETVEQLEKAIWQYVKRQKIWFKRDPKIQWYTLTEKKKIKNTVKAFLKKNN